MSPCMATVVSSVAGPPTQVGAVIGPSLQHPFTQANICPQCERALDTVKQSPRQSMLGSTALVAGSGGGLPFSAL